MRLSEKGLDLIKSFEGYHSKQPDGSCKAYKCPAGVYTCGWGCTEGVGPLTHWSQAEATEALANEMRKHERAIESMVKVPLNQHQFDAIVSLCYNIGAGNVKKSALLKHLNAGDYARAASHFSDFKYSRVSGVTAKQYKVADGTKVALAGLVSRRAAETDLFLEATPNEPMPQKVEPPRTKLTPFQGLGLIGAPTALIGSSGAPYIPSVPPWVTESITNAQAWKGVAMQLGSLGSEAYMAGGAGAVTAAGAFAALKKWVIR